METESKIRRKKKDTSDIKKKTLLLNTH